MSTITQSQTQAIPTEAHLRRRLLIAAICVTSLGLIHHVDHVIRGNHIGWPFSPAVTPFTFSLLVYPFLLIGIYLTARGRAWAGYWLAVALPILALVVFVHLVPHTGYEAPSDLYVPYTDPLAYIQMGTAPSRVVFFRDVYPRYASPVWGFLALTVMVSLVIALLALIITALRVRRISGRW